MAVIDHLSGSEQVDDKQTPLHRERDNEMLEMSSNSAMRVHSELMEDSRWRIGHQLQVDEEAGRSHPRS